MKHVLLVVFIALCGASLCSSAPSDGRLGVLFLFSSNINDLGWTSRHNAGRVAIDAAFPSTVETAFVPDVSEEYNSAYKLIKEKADSGLYSVIFGCSFGFQFPMFDLAPSYPDVWFISVSGYLSGPANFLTVFGKIFQARYLNGVLAGLYLKEQGLAPVVGVVSSFQGIPEVYQGLNALYLGLQSVAPETRFVVADTNSWYDPLLERYISNNLIVDYKAELLSNFHDSPATCISSTDAGIYCLGYHSDMESFIGKYVLSSSEWTWDGLYIDLVARVLAGNLTALDFWGSIDTGVFRTGTVSPFVSDAAKLQVDQLRAAITSGAMDVYCGARADPWRTNSSGDCLSDAELRGMMSFHPNVEYLGIIKYPLVEVYISEPVRIAMQTLAGIAMAVCVAIMLMTLWFNNRRAVQLSTPVFLHLSLLGALVMLSAVFPLSTTPPTDSNCITPVWLIAMGFSLFFTGLLLKSMRIVYIFVMSQSFSQARLPLSHLLCLEVFVCSMFAVLLICYTVIEPPVMAVSGYRSGLSFDEYIRVCHYGTAATVTLSLVLALAALLLLAGCLLSFLVRRAPKELQDAKLVSLCIYDLSFVLGVLTPVIIIIDSPTARYLLICLGLIFGTLVAVLVLFLPKLFRVVSNKEDTVTASSNSRNGGSYPATTANYDQTQFGRDV